MTTNTPESPDPQHLARLARLLSQAAQAGIDLGSVPGVPTAEWLDEKEALLNTPADALTPEPEPNPLDEDEGPVSFKPKKRRRRAGIGLAILAVLVLGFGFTAYISPGPGEWERDELESWVAGDFSDRLSIGTGYRIVNRYTDIDLDSSSESTDFMDVEFEKWLGTMSVDGEEECGLAVLQNAEMGVAIFFYRCEDDLRELSGMSAHGWQGCARKGADRVLSAALRNPPGPLLKSRGTQQQLSRLKEHRKELQVYMKELKDALDDASQNEQHGDCLDLIHTAEDRVEEISESIERLTETIRELD